MLDLAGTIEAPSEFFRSFVNVLQDGARRGQSTLPDDQMENAQRVAEQIWKAALENGPPIQTPSTETGWGLLSMIPAGGLPSFGSCGSQLHGSLQGSPGAGFRHLSAAALP